ncbi:MAG: GTP-binding protein [Candidatus Rehaiarchaeum fermentans]|nr:GTP-binding protein [Candidatus Rehaiarchaeum fermentans]
MDELKFGIERLDAIIKSIPFHRIVLIKGMPAVESGVFGYQAVSYNSIHNVNVALLLNRISPEAFLEDSKEYGLPITINKVKFLDAFTPMLGINSTISSIPVKNVESADSLFNEISKNLEGSSLFILDNLSYIIDSLGEEGALEFLSKLRALVSQNDISSLILLTDWGYSDDLLNKIYAIVDSVVNVGGIEKRVIFGQYFAVVKCNWLPNIPSSGVLFKVVKPGGVKVYIPKILVTGPAHAGKSSFIHSACNVAYSANALGETVARDIGELHYKGYVAYLHGTPGQERFDPLLRILGEESIGVILIVDSTQPESFPRALEMLRKSEAYGLPIVVVANKSNLPGAVSLDKIREALHLSEDIPIIPTVAKDLSQVKPDSWTYLDEKGVFEAIDALFSQLEQSGRLEVNLNNLNKNLNNSYE